jgi:protocatechuate 3,4-dioxygenase beta subunit
MTTRLNTKALAMAVLLVPVFALAQTSQNPSGNGGTGLLPLTLRQVEEPYYPAEKPADRDSDLTRVGSGSPASGTVLVLSGRVINQRSRPVPAASVELWQADGKGIYMHPNDSRTNQRDRSFQFFGQATTDDGGNFQFRTIMPGYYGDRPRHFHVKVIQRGGQSLTTQLYFKGDARLAQDFLTRRLGERLSALLLETRSGANNELSAESTLIVE